MNWHVLELNLKICFAGKYIFIQNFEGGGGGRDKKIDYKIQDIT
jgi:hypothetical protein